MLVPLVVRSSYSMMRGVVSPGEWVAAAKAAGLSRIALTDRNGLYGIPTFVEACEKAGLGPIAGTELVYEGGRAVLIAGTKAGFSAISRLLTARAASLSANPAAFDARAAVASCLDEATPGDLFVLTDDEVILGSQYGGDGLFALVTPCNRASWRRLAATGRRPVAAPEASFLDPEQREVQRLLLAIGAQNCIHDIGDDSLDPPEALWSAALEEASWAVHPSLSAWMEEAFASNAFIAREVLGEVFSGFVFPRFGMAEPAALLRSLVLEGAARRYGEVTAAVMERIDYELELIEFKGFCDYFLVVKDIVKRASRICGRGSAAASIVAYCLFITEVDPIRHNLYFERFLNPGRKDPPDIDVDFAWDERDALLAEVVEAYGPEHTARVANHNCFRSRSALRETARAFGMPDAEISSFEKSLRVDEAGTLASADQEWKKIARLSSSIVGLPRHLGTHSGGVIIVPDLLADHVPVETTGSGIRVTAWDKEGVETAGLVKIDLLGNRSLAVVRDALAAIARTGLPFDPDNWHPIDDADTVALLARGDTMGVFYVESPAMRLLQIKTGKGDFEHLVIHSSIIRPAANKFIDEYVDRLRGKAWKAFHPLLAELFDESYGILCYQEDVSKAAIALAGFSSTDADALRKILAKKDADTRLQEHWPAFREGALSRGVDEAAIQAVWDMMRSFSGYSFVKAHSASYAMLSFQSAYLRAHWPAQFMAAVMSNHGGFYSTLAYASESRRMGLRLLSPDVNESGWRCQGGEGAIRFGFCMVSSLGKGLAEALLAERERAGLYSSVDDFARRNRFERTDAEALVGCGAFDSLSGGASRAQALMTLLSVCAFRENQADMVKRGQDPRIRTIAGSLFSEEELDSGFSSAAGRCAAPSPSLEKKPGHVPLSPRKRRQAELKYLGTTLDSHPLELWPRAFAAPRDRAVDLGRSVGRRVRLLGWPITAKPVLTAQEEVMEFVSFEDETAIFEAVLFPDAYRNYRHLLFEEGPLWIAGLVESNRGAVSLTIENLASVTKPAQK
ncbi:MAG: DNA polymerase III subunit alpha [Rectinemataceae bacterium]|nr:DNA polymerase III subunit alpha [Rectinemataceae bacterium]